MGCRRGRWPALRAVHQKFKRIAGSIPAHSTGNKIKF